MKTGGAERRSHSCNLPVPETHIVILQCTNPPLVLQLEVIWGGCCVRIHPRWLTKFLKLCMQHLIPHRLKRVHGQQQLPQRTIGCSQQICIKGTLGYTEGRERDGCSQRGGSKGWCWDTKKRNGRALSGGSMSVCLLSSHMLTRVAHTAWWTQYSTTHHPPVGSLRKLNSSTWQRRISKGIYIDSGARFTHCIFCPSMLLVLLVRPRVLVVLEVVPALWPCPSSPPVCVSFPMSMP